MSARGFEPRTLRGGGALRAPDVPGDPLRHRPERDDAPTLRRIGRRRPQLTAKPLQRLYDPDLIAFQIHVRPSQAQAAAHLMGEEEQCLRVREGVVVLSCAWATIGGTTRPGTVIGCGRCGELAQVRLSGAPVCC